MIPLTLGSGYLPSILTGLLLTIKLSLASLFFALLLGVIGAGCKLSGIPILERAAHLYSTLIRGVPDLLIMLLIFYGGQMLVNAAAAKLGHSDYIDLDPFIAGSVTLGFIFGSYFTETFRSAILAIPHGQIEAAQAYGLSRPRVFWRIITPQMIRLAIPSFSNNWLVLLKATALVSVIGLQDMMTLGKQAAASTQKPFTFYMIVGFFYLLLTTVSTVFFSWLNRKLSAGHRRAES